MTVRVMEPSDWPSVADIYREGIATGDATFEREAPTWEQWDAARRSDCRLVAERGGRVVGFACLSPASSRAVYAGVAEVMVYVAAAQRGKGVGRRLLEALVRASEESGVWTLEAGVFPENEASVRLHERVGFRVVGVRERIGRSPEGRWRDTVLLERRSCRVG